MVSDAVSTWLPESVIKQLFETYAETWGKVMTSDEVIQELSMSPSPETRRRL